MTPKLLAIIQSTLDGMIDKIGRGWCQGSMAVGPDRLPLPWDSTQACAWCTEGALLASVADPRETMAVSIEIGRLIEQRTGLSTIRFNDRKFRTKQEVLDLLIAIRKSITPPEKT